jgi:hypothetical protein
MVELSASIPARFRGWTQHVFADFVGKNDRTIRNWVTDKHLPSEIETIERILFGDAHGEWRRELREAYARAHGGWRRELARLIRDELPYVEGAGSRVREAITPVAGALSPVDFTVSAGRPIRAKPSADVLPVFNIPVDRRDHKPRLDLCRATAAGLLKMLEQQRFNVREGYRHVLLDYIKYLPPNIRGRNLLFADQEARILRDLFAEDAAALPPEFASRLKVMLQAHMALRVFYPGLQRFYDDVRFGRTDPLPIDATEKVAAIVEEAAAIFDRSVGQALANAAPPLPASALPTGPFTNEASEASALAPPPDLLGTLPTEKAQGYLRAGVINRLYAAFLKGEALNKNSEAWAKMGERLIPHVRPIIEWLSGFLSGPPTS